jgi:hypothetical protein
MGGSAGFATRGAENKIFDFGPPFPGRFQAGLRGLASHEAPIRVKRLFRGARGVGSKSRKKALKTVLAPVVKVRRGFSGALAVFIIIDFFLEIS